MPKFLMSGVSAAALLAFAAGVQPAHAQDATDAADASGDIVVTARLRQETSISAPVVVTGVGAAEIERRQITSLDKLAQIVPQLFISDSAGAVQGGLINIRGIGTGENNPFADQSVSFNVDGIQLARSSIRRLAQADLQQIEILKGPQALFFGKNSPGGVIVIRTADPTRQFESKVSGGYEFVGDEVRAEGYVSGPLSDTLGARLFLFGSRLSGYMRNNSGPTADASLDRRRVPFNREVGGRLTLKFEPSDRFDARLKLSYAHFKGTGLGETTQLVSCPLGVPQLGGAEDCRADRNLSRADPGPNFGRVLGPQFGDGVPYLTQKTFLGGLEMNYRITDSLTLVSLTGYFDVKSDFFTNLNNADSANLSRMIAAYDPLSDKEFSQELRLQSDFDAPFNFLGGLYYQHSKFVGENHVVFNALAPAYVFGASGAVQRGDAYSAFLQAQFAITPQLELSGGGRYSYEKKHFAPFDGDRVPLASSRPKRSWENFSPEATLTFRPTGSFTAFLSYKKGFLSGGFNGSAAPPAAMAGDRSYDQQKNSGFEAGVKALLLDNRLRMNFSAYDYKITGLQTSAVAGLSTAPVLVVVNAGKARTKGFELDANLRATDGLTLRGAVAYNRARYNRFLGPCYAGQTIALGCDQLPNAAGVFQAQDQAGQQIARAPAWSLAGGANYEVEIADQQKMNLSVDANYTSSYFAQTQNNPAGRQSAYWLLDASLAYRNEARGYEIALIGRNLTNKYYFGRANDTSFTGSGVGTDSPTALLADTVASVSRGRELFLRVSIQLNRLTQ